MLPNECVCVCCIALQMYCLSVLLDAVSPCCCAEFPSKGGERCLAVVCSERRPGTPVEFQVSHAQDSPFMICPSLYLSLILLSYRATLSMLIKGTARYTQCYASCHPALSLCLSPSSDGGVSDFLDHSEHRPYLFSLFLPAYGFRARSLPVPLSIPREVLRWDVSIHPQHHHPFTSLGSPSEAKVQVRRVDLTLLYMFLHHFCCL